MPAEIASMMVTLEVGGAQALFVLVAADGSITRMGTGSETNVEQDLFIGVTEPSLFERLRRHITPALMEWCGQQLADPHPQGKTCELTVGFKTTDGEELLTAWRYGSESQGPPPEVCGLVVATVEATEPWYVKQKAMVGRSRA